MKQFIILLVAILLTASCSIAQTYTIEGIVMDTLNKSPLSHALLTLIRTEDSVIETFGRTSDDGRFALHPRKDGRYILMATYPSYADYVDAITLKNKKTISAGIIPLVSKNHLLAEFVLTQQVAAIKIKGDTTEYMADSFKTKENATVEDLLKRLPGIQVDKNGQVTAQGETVQKILVDGEEFFSDDPAVVTKGLQANAVERVQVFDKKSDQAEFTGIDDGQKTKTINLQLKEDKKKGYFGKVDAGGGTDGYYQDQGMINAFKGKRQLSAFAIMSNTDKVGLGWADNDKFSSGNGTTEITDEGQIMTTYSGSNDDFAGWDGKYNGQGMPQVWTGGLHYADKWDEDKEHLAGNYRYAKQNVDIVGNTLTENILPGSAYYNDEHKNQFSTGQRHSLDGVYEWKADTLTTIKLTANAGLKNTQTSSVYDAAAFISIDSLNATDTLNRNHRTITSNSDAQFVNADLLIRKKFAKKGRTLSFDVKENYKDAKSTGFLNSITYLPTEDSIFDQRKQNSSSTLAFAAKLTYTEPLSKITYLEMNYGVSVNNSTALNYSYDKPHDDNNYDSLDHTYSSNYKYNILTNTGGANLRFVYKKINFSFGSDVSDSKYNQQDLLNGGDPRKYDYLNLFPKASFIYKAGKQTNFTVNYYGSTTQPTIDQIQPLRQNTDPQNITIGNPNLKQQFTNAISARYFDYKVLTNRYLFANASVDFVNNAISTSQITSPANLLTTTQYVNVNGNYNGWGYLGYGYKITKLDMNVGGRISTNLNHINNYINGVYNTSTNNSYTAGLDFSFYKQDKYELSFKPGVTYNDNKSTISTFATSYWSGNGDLDGSVQLPLKFEIGSTVEILLRQRTAVFDRNNNVVRWNAYAGKKFLKKGQLELRAYINDILNQNIGYSRLAQGNMITESTYNTIMRYGMLSLIWNFTHTPAGGPAPAGGGMMIMR